LPTGGYEKAKQKTQQPTAIETLNVCATAVDVGSREHMAAVNPDVTDAPVRAFGTFTHDQQDLAAWFKSHGVTIVALESTGVYWIDGRRKPSAEPLIYLIGPLFGILAENRNHPPHGLHLQRPQPVSIVWMRRAGWRATISSVNAADPPTTHGRCLAALPCLLDRGCASGRVSEALGGVYGVSVTFHH
jgi:hypothetical protein